MPRAKHYGTGSYAKAQLERSKSALGTESRPCSSATASSRTAPPVRAMSPWTRIKTRGSPIAACSSSMKAASRTWWSSTPRSRRSFSPASSRTAVASISPSSTGNHRFDGVFVDLVYLGRLIRPGGVVFVDDYQLPAVARATSFFVANVGWTVEQVSAADELHQWAVLRTSPVADTRRFQDFVDF